MTPRRPRPRVLPLLARCQRRASICDSHSFMAAIALISAVLVLQALTSQAWGEDLVCHAHSLPVTSAADPQSVLTPGPLASAHQHPRPVPQLKATLDLDCEPTLEIPVVASEVTSADQDRLQRLGLGQVPPAPPGTSVSLAPPPLTTRAANSIRLSGDWRNWACIGAAFSRQF